MNFKQRKHSFTPHCGFLQNFSGKKLEEIVSSSWKKWKTPQVSEERCFFSLLASTVSEGSALKTSIHSLVSNGAPITYNWCMNINLRANSGEESLVSQEWISFSYKALSKHTKSTYFPGGYYKHYYEFRVLSWFVHLYLQACPKTHNFLPILHVLYPYTMYHLVLELTLINDMFFLQGWYRPSHSAIKYRLLSTRLQVIQCAQLYSLACPGYRGPWWLKLSKKLLILLDFQVSAGASTSKATPWTR